jgi:hypothetical protein
MSHSDLQLDLAFFYVESYKIRKHTYALHTVFTRGNWPLGEHSVECFFYVESYKTPMHSTHVFTHMYGVLFICRKLHLHTPPHYQNPYTAIHYKYRNLDLT